MEVGRTKCSSRREHSGLRVRRNISGTKAICFLQGLPARRRSIPSRTSGLCSSVAPRHLHRRQLKRKSLSSRLLRLSQFETLTAPSSHNCLPLRRAAFHARRDLPAHWCAPTRAPTCALTLCAKSIAQANPEASNRPIASSQSSQAIQSASMRVSFCARNPSCRSCRVLSRFRPTMGFPIHRITPLPAQNPRPRLLFQNVLAPEIRIPNSLESPSCSGQTPHVILKNIAY